MASELEISKEIHHDDDDNKNDDDDKKRKASEKSTTDALDDDLESNSKKMKTDHHDDDESKSSSRKRKVSDKTDDESKSSSSSSSSSSKKTKKVAKTAEEMAGDMLMEICLRLPPASVTRFRYNAKHWYRILSDISFLDNHAVRFHSQPCLHHIVKPSGVLVCPRDNNHAVYAILPLEDHHHHQEQPLEDDPPLKVVLDKSLPVFKTRFPLSMIIDSCNGLLLSCEPTPPPPSLSGQMRIPINPNSFEYKIYNPLLNQYKSIPRMDFLDSLFPDFSIRGRPHIVFDPSISPFYKVIVLLTGDHPEFQVYVYSSETEKWRHIKNIQHDTQYAVHWETIMFDGVWYCMRDADLVCFGLRDDTISFIQLPPIPGDHGLRDVFYFGECGGSLQLFEEYGDGHNQSFPYKFTIMEMKKSVVVPGQPTTTTTWIQKSVVVIDYGYEHLVDPEEAHESAIKVVHPYETEEGDQAILLSIDNMRLVSFNITKHTFGKELTVPGFESYDNVDFLPFTPTLFPLHTFKTL